MYGLPIAETSHCHPVLFAKVRSPERFLSKHVASCILVVRLSPHRRTSMDVWFSIAAAVIGYTLMSAVGSAP